MENLIHSPMKALYCVSSREMGCSGQKTTAACIACTRRNPILAKITEETWEEYCMFFFALSGAADVNIDVNGIVMKYLFPSFLSPQINIHTYIHTYIQT